MESILYRIRNTAVSVEKKKKKKESKIAQRLRQVTGRGGNYIKKWGIRERNTAAYI